MRFAVDTGGTFTDLIVEDDQGGLHMFKAPTTPSDPVQGVLDALDVAAQGLGTDRTALLGAGDTFIYGTTHAINAIITGNTARTAFLTSQGHPDVLVLREGGRVEPFDFSVPFPEPYVPRALTWELPGRILADGGELAAFDDAAMVRVIAEMKAKGVAAVAVCLLWSIANPAHELRVAALLDQHLPGVPYTLSHRLNPTLREYRRASSTCIDASLKPMMAAYMAGLIGRLGTAGFPGRVLVVTSQGGVIDAEEAAEAPIHLINSGPSMAPVSGRYFALVDEGADTAVIADTGGTTYDVSLVRGGRIPSTRETWIGRPYRGHITGFPSVDVKSIGAGGGSIAWVDDGGMLHVGPQSAGAQPGPACYGRGGTKPTVTDAALILGLIDGAFFLGGAMRLELETARAALEPVAAQLGLPLERAASAIMDVATENMVQAIFDITVNQGIDPREAVLIGGGGAAGLNSVAIARRLGTRKLVIPEIGAALSAAGAIMSEMTSRYATTRFARTDTFDQAGINAALAALEARCRAFIEARGKGTLSHRIDFWAEARYPEQVWEIEVPLPVSRFEDPDDLARFEAAFHRAHEELFAFADPGTPVEIVGWGAAVSCRIRANEGASLVSTTVKGTTDATRPVYFSGSGFVPTRVRRFEDIAVGERIEGPAVIESAVTSVVINPGASAERRPSGSLSIDPG